MMRVIVAGSGGRMGRMLVRAVFETEGVRLAGAVEQPGSDVIGRDAGEIAGVGPLGVPIIASAAEAPSADVLIDFTAPAATLTHAMLVADRGISMVIGTTGFSDNQLNELYGMLMEVPAVMASNYSVGVNLALQLIHNAAETLGDDYDVEITEAHHRHKVDAPSGTALSMGKAVAEGRGIDFDQAAVYTREGITGERRSGSIGFSVIRAGNIVGEHKVMFASSEERLEIHHVASDRMAFARGAVRAAVWLMDQPAGWYGMQDVLNLK